MTPYSALLGLRDPDRSSLNLSPAADADLFVDIDGLASQVRDWLGVGAPKGAVYGTYGTGKSHLLQYVARTLAPDRRFRSVYVELTGFGRKATFFDVHLRVMNVLLPVLEQLAKHREARRWLAASNLASDDVKRAVTKLGDPALSPTALATTRAWILGTGPTPTQARKEGFTGRLFERSSAVDLVKIWQLCAELQRSSDSQGLLLLIDEGEGFQKVVHPESLATLGAGVRSVLDADNQSLGCIFALNLPETRDHPFLRSDVVSRLTGKILNLEPLGSPERVERFTTALWGVLSTKPRLLTPEAMSQLARRLAAMRNAISFDKRSALTPTQRDLLQVLSFITAQALREQRPPPYSLDDLKRWIPGGFAA